MNDNITQPPGDGTQISVKELAMLANNLTPQRIYQLVSDGILPPLIDGLLPRDASITALFKYYQRDSEELKRERLLHVTACRKTKEMELAQKEGELISYDVAHARVMDFARQLKTLVRREIELSGPSRRREKLIELGVLPEIVQQFNAFDMEAEIAVITRIEKKAGEAKTLQITNDNERPTENN